MNWWMRRLRRRHLEDQLERELRFHIEEHTAGLIASGADPVEARRRARLEIGGPEQVKEACRDVRGGRWLEDLAHDVRYAVRGFRANPGFAMVALATMALGIAATTVMFTVINSVLLKPLAYPEPDRLFAVHERTDKYLEQWPLSYPNFLDLSRESRALAMAASRSRSGTVTAPGPTEHVDALQISTGLFAVLGVPLHRGREFTPAEDRPGAAGAAILGYGFWRRRFAAADSAIGAVVSFEGRAYTVIGVAPPTFELDGWAPAVLTPLGQGKDVNLTNREAQFLHVAARLRQGATPADARAELAAVSRGLAERFPTSNRGVTITLTPFRQDVVGDIGSTLWLLLGAVGLVLLIASVNLAGLLLARAVSRDREMAMRVALGASRGRLVRQCLSESGLLSLAGGAAGLALAFAGVRPFVSLWPGSLPRAAEIAPDWRVALFAVVVSLVSGLLLGLAPALRRPALHSAQRGAAASSRRSHCAFVVCEIALCIVLLISAGLLCRALLRLSSLDPGIDPHNVLTARLAFPPASLANPDLIRASWQDAVERARRVPGVSAASLVDIIPMREGENELGFWTSPTAPPPGEMPIALACAVQPEYRDVVRLPLRAGRFVDERDRAGGEPVVVIDEVLARHAFGDRDPLGQRLHLQAIGDPKVIGVVGHVRHWGPAEDDRSQVRAQLYYPLAQVPDQILPFFSSILSIALRTSVPPLSIVEPLRRELRASSDQQTVYAVRSMDQLVYGALSRERFLLLLFAIFAGLALLLASIGIYGVLAYVTNQRVPEIGVRMALGATAQDVILLVLRQSIGMILSGAALGASAAFAAAIALARIVPDVRVAEPSTFLAMTTVLIVAGLVASFLPARRASRIDPVRALRQ